jgi:methylamine utilization protein MauE
MDTAARIVLAVVLLWAAGSKVRAWRGFPDVLAAHGIPPAARVPLAVALVVAEGGLGVLLLTGAAVLPAAVGALTLGLVFTAALVRARVAGARRLPCGCFGTRERPTALLLVRALGVVGLAALAAFGDELATPSGDAVLVAAVAVLAAAVVALAALVLALYRQVGVLSLRIGPGVALELSEEGPPLEEPAPPLEGLAGLGGELVVFFSADCRLCRELAPAVRALEREGVPVRIAYEHEEPGVFAAWNIPGTPFVVHVVNGEVAAKGTVNTLEQLDGLVAVGEARVADAAV